MATDEIKEVLLRVPVEMTVKCKGLAIDMGGSVLKLAYRTKEDVEKATKNGEFGYVRLVSFERAKLKQGLDYVRQRSYITVDDDDGQPTRIYTTGIGCTEFGKLICQTLNVRTENVMEMDCFVKSFTYLADRLPRTELLEPFLIDAVTDVIDFAENFFALQSLMNNDSLNKLMNLNTPLMSREEILKTTGQHEAAGDNSPSLRPLSEAESDTFPCLLIMCGSGFGYLQINSDKTYSLFDISTHGGKGFTGIGRLLTNSESFDELLELAANGNYRTIHQYSNEACGDGSFVSEEDESVYKSWCMNEKVKPSLLFSFGKASTGQNKFSREDIAAAWLHWFILDLVHAIVLNCHKTNIKRVFFCGGFCQSELVRRYITEEMASRNIFSSLVLRQSGHVTFDFVKPGQHLGAIGCLINGLEKFI